MSLFPILFALITGCRPVPTTLAELQAASDADAAGKRLMRTPMGLNRLDEPVDREGLVVVTVHGFGSEGSEWVEPLTIFGDDDLELYFYHWQDHQCPDTGAAELRGALESLVASSPQMERLVVVAHSYGGVIATLAAQAGPLGDATELDIVASPIAGVEQMESRCGFHGVPVAPAGAGITWRQWRTVHEQDGAFKDMATDPQILALPEMEVVQLPGEWEGGRLGHNRSITYVATQMDPSLSAVAEPAAP